MNYYISSISACMNLGSMETDVGHFIAKCNRGVVGTEPAQNCVSL